MPLIRPSKLPPPPELGEKTFWDYFPRRSARRIFFLLLALGAILVLKHSGSWTLGGLLGGPPEPTPGQSSAPVYHIKVTPPSGNAPAAPAPPTPPASQSKP
jgi:hypothetical protein